MTQSTTNQSIRIQLTTRIQLDYTDYTSIRMKLKKQNLRCLTDQSTINNMTAGLQDPIRQNQTYSPPTSPNTADERQFTPFNKDDLIRCLGRNIAMYLRILGIHLGIRPCVSTGHQHQHYTQHEFFA